MSVGTTETAPPAKLIIPALGITQIFAWGSSFYLLAVLGKPIATDTGWPLEWVIGGVSLGLLCAGIVSPRVGDSIHRRGGNGHWRRVPCCWRGDSRSLGALTRFSSTSSPGR